MLLGRNVCGAREGFTYVEVMMAFMLFGMMLVFVTRIGSSVYEFNRQSGIESRMPLVAQLVYENYKTGISDPEGFMSNMGASLDEERTSGEDVVYRRFVASEVDGLFDVAIEETIVGDNLSFVEIIIAHPKGQPDEYRLSGSVLRDYQ